MSTLDQIQIRVNGIEVTGLNFRRGMVHGYPSGPWEVLVEVPILGYLELDDKPDFVIEVKDPAIHDWHRVTLVGFMTWMQGLGLMKVA